MAWTPKNGSASTGGGRHPRSSDAATRRTRIGGARHGHDGHSTGSRVVDAIDGLYDEYSEAALYYRADGALVIDVETYHAAYDRDKIDAWLDDTTIPDWRERAITELRISEGQRFTYRYYTKPIERAEQAEDYAASSRPFPLYALKQPFDQLPRGQGHDGSFGSFNHPGNPR
jgi:hypothetical protein